MFSWSLCPEHVSSRQSGSSDSDTGLSEERGAWIRADYDKWTLRERRALLGRNTTWESNWKRDNNDQCRGGTVAAGDPQPRLRLHRAARAGRGVQSKAGCDELAARNGPDGTLQDLRIGSAVADVPALVELPEQRFRALNARVRSLRGLRMACRAERFYPAVEGAACAGSYTEDRVVPGRFDLDPAVGTVSPVAFVAACPGPATGGPQLKKTL